MTGVWWAATLASLLCSSATAARAETVSAQWYAYFYAAPRADAPVLDEVERDTKLDLRGCEGGWCQVGYGEANGYVREEIVHGPSNAARPGGEHPSDGSCFTAAQPGGGAWQSERFCRSGR